ncbi:MAG: sulfite exporter TauE/SafE family protein, partial [Mailhella sp.]|nr:sulfite exporter TauE/SafE family protein [Mailhella sp.]
MDALLLLYSSVVWFFAGFVNGVTSFGGNLVSFPLMALVMDTKEAIIFVCLTGTAITISIAILYRASLPKLEFCLATAGGAVGVVPGLWLLKVAPVSLLLFLSGTILTSFLVWQLMGKRLYQERRIPIWYALLLGFFSGFFLGCTGMGGPAIAVYAVLRHWSKEETLATVNTMAAVSMLFLAGLQWWQGLYTPVILQGAAWGMPCCVLGVLISLPVIRRIDAQLFRKGLLAMLAISAL